MFALLGFASCILTMPHEEKSFVEWMRSTNTLYTGDEYHFRLGVFLTNARLVESHNRANRGFTVSLNKFACYTPAEYKCLLGHRSQSKPSQAAATAPVTKVNLPDSIDWREKNIVNAVKDQGNCGSCWAFSVIQAQESQWAKVKGYLPSLSEQNLVDCCINCDGCSGGDEFTSYDYVIWYQDGLWNTEEDYPYTANTETCKFNKEKGCCPVKSWYRPTENRNEQELAEKLVADGVVSVAIDASHWSFQLYTSGIYDEPSCRDYYLNHAVGLVGYGAENGVKYWIIRNSWGSSWGEDGYVRMVKDKNNQCGVATDTVLPQV